MDRSPICFDDDDDDTDDDTDDDDDDDDGDDDIEEYPRALTLSLFQGKTAEPAEFYCFTSACLLYYLHTSHTHTSACLLAIHIYLYLCYTHTHTHTHPSPCYTHLSLLYFTPLPVC